MLLFTRKFSPSCGLLIVATVKICCQIEQSLHPPSHLRQVFEEPKPIHCPSTLVELSKTSTKIRAFSSSKCTSLIFTIFKFRPSLANFWVPEVYQGAPFPSMSFFTTFSKFVYFIFFFKQLFFLQFFSGLINFGNKVGRGRWFSKTIHGGVSNN